MRPISCDSLSLRFRRALIAISSVGALFAGVLLASSTPVSAASAGGHVSKKQVRKKQARKKQLRRELRLCLARQRKHGKASTRRKASVKASSVAHKAKSRKAKPRKAKSRKAKPNSCQRLITLAARRHATPTPKRPVVSTPVTPTETSTSPSGVSMPTGNLPGWQQVLADDFTGTTLGKEWTQLWGQAGGNPGGWWTPSHLVVSNGELQLQTYSDPAQCLATWGCTATNNEVSGGVELAAPRTYGKYLVRMRAENGKGIAVGAMLLPSNGSWPPEIDFVEDNGASPRSTNYVTLHYGAQNTMVEANEKVNLSEWHTYGVEWTAGKLVYTLDGNAWATMASSNVPSQPMDLVLQQEAWACGTDAWEECPNASTPAKVNFDVDWVVAYAPS